MNVLHLQLSGGIGGIVVLCKELNNVSKNNNFFYFVFEGGTVCDEIKNSGGNVFVANDNNKSFITGAKKLVKYCKENKIDIVIGHTGSPIIKFLQIYAINHINGLKSIMYLHTNAEYELPYSNPIKRFVCKGLYQKCHDISNHTVAISDSVKDSFVDVFNFNKDRIDVIYNGINCNKFYSKKQNNNIFHLVYVGRIIEEKGLKLLLKSVSNLPKEIKFELQIIGDGEKAYIEELKKFVKSSELNDKVIFTGGKSNVEDYLAKSDFFIHPSVHKEGFGISLVEAMASSVPCIAFKKGAILEIITDEYNGLIVSDFSDDSLTKKIVEAYSIFTDKQKYLTYCDNARETSKKFTIKKMTDELENLY